MNSLVFTSAPMPVMQDGGLPVVGIAKAIDPDRWDAIVSDFLLTEKDETRITDHVEG